ncbi:MAG: zf-HC2 domain-containing protein [Nitrospinae bacterium]|jgi:anti-sigma factor RsiW|nr:zf-HC2 domain-containing protein [Nitrospinota bacterium]MDA1110312.1 zf-HC2 domain-containing protein [Nitrospinota bacterium]
MICCKECLELLSDYLDGELDPQTSSSLNEHFQDCPPCVAFLNTFKTSTNLCRETIRQVDLPEVVQIKLKEFLAKNTRKKD